MKRLYIIFLLLTLNLSACRGEPAPLGADAPVDNVPDIVGEYALNATDGTGEEYGGTLIVLAGEKPNEYKLQWLVSGGIHEGTGTLTGNQLTFTWRSLTEAELNLSGTGVYTVTINGELYGERFINGVEKPGIEAAYPNSK